MQIIHSSQIDTIIPDWAHQLAQLTRIAWTGPDGHCYFPYLPLTTETEWFTNVASDWAHGRMHSWVAVINGQIVAHAALVHKGTYWEIGRFVAHKAPRTAVWAVDKARVDFCREQGIHARRECTQAHASSQWHAMRLGLRFAGIGILDVINGVRWDIIFFDTLQDRPAFRPRPGVLGDPLGKEILCTSTAHGRLHEISSILTTDRGGSLPPTRFHTLPELMEPIQKIIELNLSHARPHASAH